MTSRDGALRFCDAADALLKAHADDIALHGSARPQAQCEFARIGYGALEEACELVRELVAEVTALRTGVNESEGALLQMVTEAQAENERLRGLMPCGHPRVCLVSSDDERDSTVNCAWCVDNARWEGLLELAAENAEGFRELFIESERKVVVLKAEAKLNAAMLAQQCDLARDAETALARERMRATVGGASVL